MVRYVDIGDFIKNQKKVELYDATIQFQITTFVLKQTIR